MKLRTILTVLIILTFFSACRHRLRPQLYQIENNSRIRLEQSDCYYSTGFRLSDKPDSIAFIPGVGNLLITNQTLTDTAQVYFPAGIMSVDKKITYRIYIDLPEKLTQDSLDITDRSICHIIGQYELDEKLKMYYCRRGYLLIDSLKRSGFYGILSAQYQNRQGDTLVFEGNMKVKRKK